MSGILPRDISQQRKRVLKTKTFKVLASSSSDFSPTDVDEEVALRTPWVSHQNQDVFPYSLSALIFLSLESVSASELLIPKDRRPQERKIPKAV